MAIIAKQSDRDFTPVAAGTYPAICQMVVDLGLQKTGWGAKHKVLLSFEIPDKRVEYDKDGEHFNVSSVITETYTVSLSDKSILRGMLESWRGRAFIGTELDGFDITKVLGAPCMINVIHNTNGDKTYANVAAIMPLPKGLTQPVSELGFVLYDDEHSENREKLPDWIRKKLDNRVSDNDAAIHTASDPMTNDDLDDDIPF